MTTAMETARNLLALYRQEQPDQTPTIDDFANVLEDVLREAAGPDYYDNDHNITHLSFVRYENGKVDASKGLIIEMLEEGPDPLEELRFAVTRWVKETERGLKLWEYSCEDLNVGDLNQSDFDDIVHYARWISRIKETDAIMLGGGVILSFDLVLADNPG